MKSKNKTKSKKSTKKADSLAEPRSQETLRHTDTPAHTKTHASDGQDHMTAVAESACSEISREVSEFGLGSRHNRPPDPGRSLSLSHAHQFSSGSKVGSDHDISPMLELEGDNSSQHSRDPAGEGCSPTSRPVNVKSVMMQCGLEVNGHGHENSSAAQHADSDVIIRRQPRQPWRMDENDMSADDPNTSDMDLNTREAGTRRPTLHNALLEIYIVHSSQEPNKFHKCFLHAGLLFSDSISQKCHSWTYLVLAWRSSILLQSLVVVLAFLYANLLLSFLLPCPSFPHLNSPQSLSSFLSQKSRSSISIVHPHHLLSLNLFLFFWMNLTPFFLSLPPHLMNL